MGHPFVRNLEKLGIRMTQRSTDNALFQKRLEEFDFDMTHYLFADSQSPGNELVDRFTSPSADVKGSENLIGLRSPVIDMLVREILEAHCREALETACRALDRVLMNGHYAIPHFYSGTHRVAYKRQLQMPSKFPLYYRAEDWIYGTWWEGH